MRKKQTKNSTFVPRCCQDCSYWEEYYNASRIGWCYWLGKYREGSRYECEDGFKE